MSNGHILIVEDEPDIAELIQYNLGKEGYETTIAPSGNDALTLLKDNTYDLILLDLMLPGIQGLDICRIVRTTPEAAGISIIMLTAKTDELDKIIGLEIGADDYMTKPFSPRELVARVKAVLRRASGPKGTNEAFRIKDLLIDPSSYSIRKNGNRVQMSTTEFKVFLFLAENKGKIYNRNMILDRVWENGGYVEPRTVDVHIRRIRMQIEDDPQNPIYIKTKRGIGYYFDPGVA